MPEFISFENVEKIYRVGEVDIHALNSASFTVKQGEICVIVGASGAGKTTILNILGGMDTMTGGKVWLDGKDILQELSDVIQGAMDVYRIFALVRAESGEFRVAHTASPLEEKNFALPADHPLVTLPPEIQRRVILAPHLGGITEASFRRAHAHMWRNAQRLAAGERPDSIVNGLA